MAKSFSQFIDVTTQSDGILATGCLPRDDKLGENFPLFGEYFQAIPRSEWKSLFENDVSVAELVAKIKNQGQEGTCASNAATQCGEIVANRQLGKSNWIELSPISIYRWISNNPNRGSTISGNLRQFRDVGALPVNSDRNKQVLETAGLDPSHVLKTTGYYQSFPSGWKETAKHFRVHEWFDISNFDELVTAMFLDCPVCYGRAGHAICGCRPYYRNGSWFIKYANSWGQWGDPGGQFNYGFGYDSERFVSGSIRSYGAWAARTMILSDEIVEAILQTSA